MLNLYKFKLGVCSTTRGDWRSGGTIEPEYPVLLLHRDMKSVRGDHKNYDLLFFGLALQVAVMCRVLWCIVM